MTAAQAQVFVSHNADLCLGFRKTGAYAENNEVVVDLGTASNYVNLAIGTTTNISTYTAAQLTASFSSLNNLQWSVTGYQLGKYYPNYPTDTLWLTVPRSSPTIQSQPLTRQGTSYQNTTKTPIQSIFAGAAYISQQVATSNQFNTPFFVQEAMGTYSGHNLSTFMASLGDPTQGTLNDTWYQNLEITTPGTFSGYVRSDLYEVRPLTDSSGNFIVDPHVGTNSSAYYLGYFQFNSNGTMTFTRAAASTSVPQPVLSMTRSGSASTISFASSSGATYTLCFTNSAGLTTPSANWPTNTTTIPGDGTIKSFTDSAGDPNRFYRVIAR